MWNVSNESINISHRMSKRMISNTDSKRRVEFDSGRIN